MNEMDTKKQHGQFFTTGNPFGHPAFSLWASNFPADSNILEPYAGANGLIKMLREVGLAKNYSSFDIVPAEVSVVKRDVIKDFPKGYKVCVTNPPYLAKNSATRSNTPIPPLEGYDNLWKLATARCLENCEFVAAIIPESFITSGLFTDRLESVISLNFKMFEDTDQPVCLALWGPKKSPSYLIYKGDKSLGTNLSLEKKVNKLLPEVPAVKTSFNDVKGKVGLKAIDNTVSASIKFVPASDIAAEEIKVSSRHRTRIVVDSKIPVDKITSRANLLLDEYRVITSDVFLTSFRGIREDGSFRRRLDWASAKRILEVAVSIENSINNTKSN
jgi:hypothetical protein